jgi:hypothetical protein
MTTSPLSEAEVTALMQIRMGAKLDAKHRAVLQRLFHWNLIKEGAGGLSVTPAGEERYKLEAGKEKAPDREPDRNSR